MSTPRIDKLDRNLIINGGMDFWQRGTSFVIAANPAAYTADRFILNGAGTGTRTVTRSTTVPNSKSNYSWQSVVGTAQPSLSAGHYEALNTRLEGQFIRELYGSTFTVSFWVRSSLAGKYYVSLQNGAQTRCILKGYTINTANTWEYKSIVVAHEGAGVNWAQDNTNGMFVWFCLASGSGNQNGTVDSWFAGAAQSGTDQVNFMATAANQFNITGIKIVLGDTSLSTLDYIYAGRNLIDELRLCKRYYEKSYAIDTPPGTVTNAGKFSVVSVSANRPYLSIPFKVEKRVVPTVSVYNPATGALGNMRNEAGTDSGASIDVGNRGTNQFDVFQNSNFNAQGAYGHWVADAEL